MLFLSEQKQIRNFFFFFFSIFGNAHRDGKVCVAPDGPGWGISPSTPFGLVKASAFTTRLFGACAPFGKPPRCGRPCERGSAGRRGKGDPLRGRRGRPGVFTPADSHAHLAACARHPRGLGRAARCTQCARCDAESIHATPCMRTDSLSSFDFSLRFSS